MLVSANIELKSINHLKLLENLKLNIESDEKIAIIGRNGVGKSTLFRMLTGEDTDYTGNIISKPGIRLVSTRQEHHDMNSQTVMEYIINSLPEYTSLKHIIDTYPETMVSNMRKIEEYSEAIERFTHLDYYNVYERILRSLSDYQLTETKDRQMSTLSGGQKRFVELIRVKHSDADLALIDEPTNHMDYIAKEAFLSWFMNVNHAVVVITHDRDLLQHVSRIIEIVDFKAVNFPGNYDSYLLQNTLRATSNLNEYDTSQRRIANVKKQIQYARSKKASWGGTADKKNPFVVMENRLLKELKSLQSTERPSFWIDQESITSLKPELEASYQKHKAKTIRISKLPPEERIRDLVLLDNVQVGYGEPLFEPVNLRLQTGQKVQIIGRNGVGKTSLIRTIIQSISEDKPSTLLSGNINLDSKLRINNYEQEINEEVLDLSLGQAIDNIYESYDLPCNREQILRILSDYLFDPYTDYNQKVSSLSGGQKARLQIIKMFVNNPNLLILDEPTNHLDLPSIEELESALKQYRGAILYVSHDSYLARQLGGDSLFINSIN